MDGKESNRYVAIDFETMDTWRASVCAVGCAVFEDGKLVDKYYSLVCPPSKNENYYCVQTHGLKYKDVRNSPTFDEVWQKVDDMIGDSPIVAHNAPFEKSCIDACADVYETKSEYKYIDTLKECRRLYKGVKNHKLDTMCRKHRITLKNYHNALDDAVACGKLYWKILNN